MAWWTDQPGSSGPSTSQAPWSSPPRRRNRPFFVPTGRRTLIREHANAGGRYCVGTTGGEEMSKLKEKVRRFLAENPFVGTVTTLRPDGSPHSTIVWGDVEDGKGSVNTAHGRAEPTYLARHPPASLPVVHPHDPYKWGSVR